MHSIQAMPRRAERHRAIFLSDLHLGTLGSRADLILEFLEAHTGDTIYLVGDILDIWHPLVIRWGATETRIIELLRQRAAEGCRIIYLLGNHDTRFMAEGAASPLGTEGDLPVEPKLTDLFVAQDGRRYLVLHGDVCDARPLRFHLLTRIGSRIDSLLVLVDGLLRRLRIAFGPHGRGPLKLLLSTVNDLLYRSRSHERRLVALAAADGLDGVICGHFHLAAMHHDHGLLYVNCGDWVDSFTAVVETQDGRLRLLSAAPHGTGLPAREMGATVGGGA